MSSTSTNFLHLPSLTCSNPLNKRVVEETRSVLNIILWANTFAVKCCRFFNCYLHIYSKENSRLNRLNQSVARKPGKENVLVSSEEKHLLAKACENLMPFDDDTTSFKKFKHVPVVCRHWELKYQCNKDAGGLFFKSDSQVFLRVPPEAVASEAGVVIHAAVCADVDRIRRVLQLPDDESVVSPLAEYWAGPDFRFQRPVTITLPHCLPTDFHPSLVRVYRVDHGQDGQPIVTRVSQGPGLETADCGYPWEENSHYRVSSEGQISVYTDHFCGYVCTYCEKKQSCPELVAMAYGSNRRTTSGRHTANVDVYIWDKRIDIADFRAEYGIGMNGTRLGQTTLELLDDVQNTKLAVRMEVIGPDAELWQHIKRQNGQLVNPPIQERPLMRSLSCDNAECKRSRSAPPMNLQWRLETSDDVISCDVCQFVLDFSHVPSDTSMELVEWQHRQQKEVYTRLNADIQLQPASVPGISTGNSQELHDDEVHLVLSKQEATRLEHAAKQVGISIHGRERKRRYASASTAENAYPEGSGQAAPKRVATYGGASASTYMQSHSAVHGMHLSQLGTSAESYAYAPATLSSMSVVPYTPPARVMRLSPSLASDVTEVGLNQALIPFQQGAPAVIVRPDATLTPFRSRSPSPEDKQWQKVISMVSSELSTSGSKNFFLELGLQNFDSIERNFANHGIERINLECLIAWRQKFSGKATAERLKEVLLETVERRDIVDKIDIILNESRQEANGTNDDQSSR